MLNGTPWHFERMKVEQDAVGVVVSHVSLDNTVKVNGKVLTDSTGWPRGHITGDYEGTSKIELATQEVMEHVVAMFQASADPLTVTFSYAPVEGDAHTLTLFLRIDEMAMAEKKGAEESMTTLNFLHADVMQVDGEYIIEDRRAA